MWILYAEIVLGVLNGKGGTSKKGLHFGLPQFSRTSKAALENASTKSLSFSLSPKP